MGENVWDEPIWYFCPCSPKVPCFVGGHAESTPSALAILTFTQHDFHNKCDCQVTGNSSYKSLLNGSLLRN